MRSAYQILNDLVDLQNGPPLEKYRTQWEEVMSEAYEFLNNSTTKIIKVEEDLFGIIAKMDVVECCKIGPVPLGQNYCSNCGAKIKRAGD